MNKLTRRVCFLTLVGCLILQMITPALAVEGDDTLYIYDAEELMEFVQSCSYDAWSQGKTISLERDISLSGVDYFPAASFGGVFEGNDHIISDVTITGSVSPAGFFGILQEGAAVRNLQVAGTVSPNGSGENVGGVAGINRGTIINCSFTGTVNGDSATGGIAGENASTGVIQRSIANGGVFGKSMTGGVAGENSGTLTSCVSHAYVNTNTLDPTVSLNDLHLSLELRDGLQKLTSPDTFNVTTDSGGVAGFSDGLILTCRNNGTVGYQHIGYNVGGIVGRSGGHISGCVNSGRIYGRRGVGGIVGVAEPDVIRNVSENSLEHVRRELDTLNTIVNQASRDIDATASTVSGRLAAIGGSVDIARDRAEALTDILTDYWDGTVAEIDRGSEILDGAIDRLGNVTTQARKAAETLSDALAAAERALADLTQDETGGTDAVDNFSSMAEDLRTASEILDSGLSEISAGLNDLAGTDLAEQLKSGKTGFSDIFQGLKTAADGLAAASAELESISDQIQRLERPDISGLKEAFRQSHAGFREIRQGLDSLQGPSDREISILDSGLGRLQNGLDILSNGRSQDSGGVFFYLGQAMEKLGNIAGAAQSFSKDIQQTVDLLQDATDQMTAALRDAEKLVNYLQDQKRLSFSTLGVVADASADSFYDSLHDISNHLDRLNTEVRADSGRLTEDMRKINDQFNRMINVLLNTVEDAGNTATSDLVKDTSDENIDAVTQGKVFLSQNSGIISGDIDVGGIAGAMEIYNDLNPEEDTLTLSSLLHHHYQLKCLIQDCTNSGEVTGKRNNVAAICGDARLGVISGCLAYGSAQSESGDNVGGIAGSCDNIIRKCWVKCSLSGKKYIGGIVGYADSESTNCVVDRCRSLVEITGCEQHGGAIAGIDAGVFSSNRFVSDTLAGLDRVSYWDRAQPVTYAELLEEDGLPSEFRRFSLTFRAEGSEVKSIPFRYGDSLEKSVIPAVPQKSGMYGKWDRTEFENLRLDTTVNAVYAPYVTALPSQLTRSAARPIFFVEGNFDDQACLEVSPEILNFKQSHGGFWRTICSYHRDILEQWRLTCSDDGNSAHTVRYLAPETGTGQLEIYARVENGWERLDINSMGSYLIFQIPRRAIDLTVLSTDTPWWIWGLLALLTLDVTLLVLTFLIRKKASQTVLTEEEKLNVARQAKRRARMRIILLSLVAALSFAVGVLFLIAPQVTSGMELYRLLRGYAERSQLPMCLEISTRRGQADFRTKWELNSIDFEGKRLLQMEWQGISLTYCDGSILMENGNAFRLDDTLPDYSELLPSVAGIYRSMNISATEQNGVKTYHAVAVGDPAQSLLKFLLTWSAHPISATDRVAVDVITTDGELTAIQMTWSAEDGDAWAELTFPHDTAPISLPQQVTAALRSGKYTQAQPMGEEFRQLLIACAECLTRDPITAQVAFSADCGPLLLSEELTWQRTQRYDEPLSCVGHNGTVLWFTQDAACLDNGLSASLEDAARMDAGSLLTLAYQAILQEGADCKFTVDDHRYSVALDANTMTEFARVIAPESENMNIDFDAGSVSLTVQNAVITDMVIRCEGSMHIVRNDVPAWVSARLALDRDGEFPPIPEKVKEVFGIGSAKETPRKVAPVQW